MYFGAHLPTYSPYPGLSDQIPSFDYNYDDVGGKNKNINPRKRLNKLEIFRRI
jgi:hypothetical protein